MQPTIPVNNFHIFTYPQSFKKAKTLSPGNIPLFHLKVGKTPFQPSLSKVIPPSKSINLNIETQNQPLYMMDRMVAARYAPLVLPQPLNSLPSGD